LLNNFVIERQSGNDVDEFVVLYPGFNFYHVDGIPSADKHDFF